MPHEEDKKIVIHIDKKNYHVEVESMTGQELRNLADPKITDDRDLFLKMDGSEDDKLVAIAETVKLKNGMHFYSAPKDINPGVCLS